MARHRAGISARHVVFGLLLGVLSVAVSTCASAQPAAPPPPVAPLSDRSFFIHDIGHRCVDFGGQAYWQLGGPVYTYSCNGSIAQQVRVKEIDATHDVKLMVQSQYCIGVRGGTVAVGQPLELQTCDDASPAQRFALDGDAILIGTQTSGMVARNYVIEPQADATPLRTPMVVGTRDVGDGEYFILEAVDHSGASPTSGFVRVSSEAALDSALALGWGTVIEIDPSQPLDLEGMFPKRLHAGVTMRGYRKYTFQGPEVHTCAATDQPIFTTNEDHVRLTGMRLRGPNGDPRCKSMDRPEAQAILIEPTAGVVVSQPTEAAARAAVSRIDTCSIRPGGCPHVPDVLVDHLDIGYFTGSGVDTRGTDGSASQTCPANPPVYPRATPVRVIGNFIHHNGAYGSVTGDGAFILNDGNVFYRQHAHAIASDPWGTTGYAAFDNFILSEERDTHDVDMHGSLDPGHWQGGLSGDYYDVGWNTFLHTGWTNINQRGTPCRFTAIHDSIFLQSQGQAIITATTVPVRQVVYANAFNAANPTGELAVGDFDGDGIDDVFVGTGSAWYFSSGGQAEWRLLNRMPEHANQLLFGDLDGDGRTDVIAIHNGNIDVSWGGVSPWQTINVTAWTIDNMAVGDFDGDGRADLFLSTGTMWFWAPGGRNWAVLDTSSYERSQLLFGDFLHDGRTHVLRVSNGRWLAAGLNQHWTDIGSAPVGSVAGLVVGDFDGDGFADVARTAGPPLNWQMATPAHSTGWSVLRFDATAIASHPIGRFDANRTSDVLLWDSLHFSYAPGGRDPVQPLSRQDMR
jgi:hypothetical protein